MTTTEPRLIEHTKEPMRHPWPADCYVQGGNRGVVLTEDGSYWTAFVEAFPGTFIRGEGVTIADAEDACWKRFEHLNACPTAPDHGPFEAQGYTNGSGFCTNCGGWFSRVLLAEPHGGKAATR